jgi:MerR family mercuric resistance operon transcriptional regulator
MEQLMRGELAKEGGVNLETVRYYERQGLLPKPPRSPSGYRLFPSDSVRRVRFIKRAQELGFSLKEIKELLALRVSTSSTASDVKKRAEAKVADIEEKIQTLRAMKKALARLTATCCGEGSASECPILESLSLEKEKR